MAKLEYTFKTDTLFKMLFVKHQDLLEKLVAELLGIRLSSIGNFKVTNPEMPPENLEDKFCRLDINMTVDGVRVNLEIQVEDKGDYPERMLYHWAREYSSALPSGGRYLDLPRAIIISIINFNLFDCEAYHSEFEALEVTRHEALSDKMALHFFELKKLPGSLDKDDVPLLWLSLFRAETEEELSRIKALEVSEMTEAINAYQSIVASPEFREVERLREKARHDEAQAIWYAEQKAEERINAKWESVVADKDSQLADKDTQLADKDTQLADKDAQLADKDTLIAELRRRLGGD